MSKYSICSCLVYITKFRFYKTQHHVISLTMNDATTSQIVLGDSSTVTVSTGSILTRFESYSEQSVRNASKTVTFLRIPSSFFRSLSLPTRKYHTS